MDRKEFLKSTLKLSAGLGLFCGCAGNLAAGTEPGKKPLTPCDEKVKFTKGWVKRFFDILDNNLDEETRKKIMEMNGKACYSQHYTEEGHRRRLDMDIDTYVEKLSEYVGKENCFCKGNKVYFNYVENPKGLKIADGYCLCPMVEDGPKDLSHTYCYCSVGYVKEMFSRVLPYAPQVELLESLRLGGKRCRFVIHLRAT